MAVLYQASTKVRSLVLSGMEPSPVDVEVQITGGLPAFQIVGLPDKAVAESRERVRAALASLQLSLPQKRIVVNLAPADLTKEGSHFDLPIAIGVLCAMGILDSQLMEETIILGELGLDGSLKPVPGVLAAALFATQLKASLICPSACAGEAAWLANEITIVAAGQLLELIRHIRGEIRLPEPEPAILSPEEELPDLKDVKGQESARRALEIAAAGGHNLLMMGPPGAGKSMLARRIISILPELDAREILETGLLRSAGGQMKNGYLQLTRPFRAPHHTASPAAMVGGGLHIRPGEASLAHHGVLFLDEFPEFSRAVLEALRQPIESGSVTVARANRHVTYPARFQLIAAMNPCRCGYLDEPHLACNKAPKCASDYQRRISGPIYERIDMHIDVPALSPSDLKLSSVGEPSEAVKARVIEARERQKHRYKKLGYDQIDINARADGEMLDKVITMDDDAQSLLSRASESMRLSARSYHRILKVARTAADLAQCDRVSKVHIAEAIVLRQQRAFSA